MDGRDHPGRRSRDLAIRRVMAGLLMAWSAAGLSTQWQSRRTVVPLVRTAPEGLTTIHRDSPGGQVLRLAREAYPGRRKRQSRS